MEVIQIPEGERNVGYFMFDSDKNTTRFLGYIHSQIFEIVVRDVTEESNAREKLKRGLFTEFRYMKGINSRMDARFEELKKEMERK